MDIALRRAEDAVELARLIRETRDAKQRDRLRAVELAIAGRTHAGGDGDARPVA